MRIIHFADAHIGVETHSRPITPDELEALPSSFAPGVNRRATYAGMASRLIDSLRALDELVEFALADPKADLVVFAGDAYRSRDPSQTHQREFARRIGRLAAADIPVFLLAGNHDIPNTEGRATAIDIFDALSVTNVTIGSRLGAHRIETRDGPVQVLAVPWLRRSSVAAQADQHGKSADEVDNLIQALLTSEIQRMAGEIDPEVPTILAAHATVSTATLGHEGSLMMGNDYVLLPSALQPRPIDYAALGHVHRHQALAATPPVVYAGSLNRVDFSEEKDSKGFCVIDIDPRLPAGQRVVDWSFNEVWSRPFLTIRVSLTGREEDALAVVEAQVGRHDVTDAVARVEVRAPIDLAGSIDVSLIRGQLTRAGAHVVAGVAIQTDTPDRSRTRLDRGMAVETLAPMEALEFYLQNRAASPSRRDALLQGAKEIINLTLGGEPGLNETSGGNVSKEDDSAVTVRVAVPADMDAVHALRRLVFIDEQGVDPEEEWDGLDDDAVHAVAILDDVVVGTGRLLLGGGGAEARIGRMAVRQELRREGIGARILAALEAEAASRGAERALLHAQTYVKEFYAGAGYTEHGDLFYEAGIEHVAMIKDLGGEDAAPLADGGAGSNPHADVRVGQGG